MPLLRRLGLALLAFCLLASALILLGQQGYRLPAPLPNPRLTRPYGMAPAAFEGFKRACFAAHVHPNRIGQTIGDYPLSAGYHKRDGTLQYRGQTLDYTAAVDLGTSDLTRPQIERLLEALARQSFAAFYREGGKWRGQEHIHAIYAPLPMKPQLRAQVREWRQKRKRQNKPLYSWQRKYRRNWQ